MVATEKIQRTTYLADAGGDTNIQLTHLKAHLAFQKQAQCKLARVNWATTVTRAESRRHITHCLDQKINNKVSGFYAQGKVNTHWGQRKLRSVASHAQGGNFHGNAGEITLPWNLRFRMYRQGSLRRGIAEAGFWELNDERAQPNLRRKEEEFLPEIQCQHALYRKRVELVKRQGGNPKRHRDAIIIEGYTCPGCHRICLKEDPPKDRKCRACLYSLNERHLSEMACDPGNPPCYIGKQ